MRQLASPIGLRTACLLATALSSGCLATPKPASSIVPVIYRPSRVPESDAKAGPTHYWKHTGPDAAGARLSAGQCAAISEFDVEFVDLQLQSGFGPQSAFRLPPLVLGPLTPIVDLGFGLQLSGLGRKNARLSNDEQQRLANSLYDQFAGELRGRGLIVVNRDKLATCDSFAALRTRPSVQTSPLLLLNLAGSDTGFVMHSRTVAADRLGVVTASSAKRRAAETSLLRDVGADIAMAVRLRVGVFRGKAALEEGSTIRVKAAGGETTFTAKHSILSDLDVIHDARFRPIVGKIESVEAKGFSRELATMLPVFLNLAFADSAPKSVDPETTRLPAIGEPGSVPAQPQMAGVPPGNADGAARDAR